MAGDELNQIPAIAVEIEEHRDRAIIIDGGRADPFDAGGGKGGMIALEIVGGEEEEDAPAGLIADKVACSGVAARARRMVVASAGAPGGRMVTQRLSCAGW